MTQAPSTRSAADPALTPLHPALADDRSGARVADPTARLAALGHRSRLPWALALGGYTVLVACVVGWPTPVDANARAPLSQLFAYLYGLGVPAWFDYAVLEKSANVAMFVPFGLLITGLDRRRWYWGVLAPAAVSGAAELAQHVLLPERTATWTDVAANSGGAVLGVAVALVLTARGRPARRASRRRH